MLTSGLSTSIAGICKCVTIIHVRIDRVPQVRKIRTFCKWIMRVVRLFQTPINHRNFHIPPPPSSNIWKQRKTNVKLAKTCGLRVKNAVNRPKYNVDNNGKQLCFIKWVCLGVIYISRSFETVFMGKIKSIRKRQSINGSKLPVIDFFTSRFINCNNRSIICCLSFIFVFRFYNLKVKVLLRVKVVVYLYDVNMNVTIIFRFQDF